jgi:hypothetical protein
MVTKTLNSLDEQDSVALALTDLVGNGASFYFKDVVGSDPLFVTLCHRQFVNSRNLMVVPRPPLNGWPLSKVPPSGFLSSW